MIRTQLSFRPDEISWLRRQARLQGVSMAEVVRELIHQRSESHEPHPAPRRRRSLSGALKKRFPWIGLAKDAPPTDAALAEDYLYREGEAL